MQSHHLHDRSGRISAQVTLLLLCLFGAVALVAATTNAVSTNPVPAALVEVAIVANGDIGQYAGMCGSLAGSDSLYGSLNLKELGDDGTARYEGELTRITEVDACGTKPAPTEDQVAMCFAHLSGRAVMAVTLEVYEDNRGAWVKMKSVSVPAPATSKQIRGCPEPGEWLDTYPDDGWMSGLGFDTVPSGQLFTGTFKTENTTLYVF